MGVQGATLPRFLLLVMILRILETGPGEAAFNMALDEAVARSVISGDEPVTLRLYSWKGPSLSIGSFQRLDGIRATAAEGGNIPFVKRPTGGRAILHGDELTYSIASRYEGPFRGNLFECYGVIARALALAVGRAGVPVEIKERRGRAAGRSAVCFQSVSFGEITVKGRKLIGSAQKRWTGGFLQQGSIPYAIDEALHREVFEGFDPAAMIGLDAAADGDFDRGRFVLLLKEAFSEVLGAEAILSEPSAREARLAEGLTRKYRSGSN